MPETRLQLLRRQVAEMERQVDRQRKIVADFRDGGQPSEGAANILKSFESVLASYQADLARAEAEFRD